MAQRMTAALLVATLAGCAGSGEKAPVDHDTGMPADFSLDLKVLAGAASVPPASEAPIGPASVWPGHYAVLCDGSLYWAPHGDGLPPRRRALDEGQLEELWELVRRVRFDEPGREAVNPRLVEAGRGELVHLAIVTAAGKRWTVVRRTVGGEPMDEGMTRLVEELAALAWVSPPRPRRPVAPRRYDYGPDPYSRYRRP